MHMITFLESVVTLQDSQQLSDCFRGSEHCRGVSLHWLCHWCCSVSTLLNSHLFRAQDASSGPPHPITVKLFKREYHPLTTHLTPDAVICPAGTLQAHDISSSPDTLWDMLGAFFLIGQSGRSFLHWFSMHDGRSTDLWWSPSVWASMPLETHEEMLS